MVGPEQAQQLAGRWTLRRRLGSGTFGVVYEAYDGALEEPVALKLLHVDTPANARTLKHEFRSLRDLTHPNLVRLRDLVVDSGRAFFTMDLVEGVDLSAMLTRIRGTDRFADRVREVFGRIAAGLATLHAHGLVHRDLKPTNILVRADDQPVILDFGFAMHLGREASQASVLGVLTGTPAYAAPEQLQGAPLGPPSDCYALGVMLFEALVGSRPPADASLALRAPLDPRVMFPDAPADLSALAYELLANDPARRPSAEAVARRLAGGGSSKDARAGVAARPRFIGRARELAALDALRRETRGGARLFVVSGEPGIGKTSLIEHFACMREGSGDLVLRGRCHIHERIPFNAIDGVVDDLVRFLRRLGPAVGPMGLVPASPSALVAMFPAFEEVFRGAAGRTRMVTIDEQANAFDALAEVIDGVARTRPVLVTVDDAQWADSDSQRVLRRLAESREPGLLIVGTWRVEARDSGVKALGLPEEAVARLGPLDDAERRELASSVACVAGLPLEDTQRIAEAGLGHPLLTQLVADHFVRARTDTSVDIASVVRSLQGDLLEGERDLLMLAAASTDHLPHEVLRRAWRFTDAPEPLCERLVSRHLLRVTMGPMGWAVAPYHGLVRDALLDSMNPKEMAETHARLAAAHQASSAPDVFALVHHEQHAGHGDRASALAEQGAEQAIANLAFGRAASLFGVAVELARTPAERARLGVRLGQALILDGRGIEGGKAILSALEHDDVADAARRIELLCAAAEHILRGGERQIGVATMRRALELAKVSWRRSAVTALASMLHNRARLALSRRWRRPSGTTETVDAKAALRLRVMWSAGVGLSFYEPLRAFDFQARHARLAAQTGARRDLALAHSTEAMIVALRDGPASSSLTLAHQSRAHALIRREQEPESEAHLRFMETAFAYSEWQFPLVLERAQAGVAFCRAHCPGAQWERAGMAWLETSALGQMGQFEAQREAVARAMVVASRVGDLFTQVMLDMGPSMLHKLARGEVERALRDAEAARPLAGASGYLLYQYGFTVVRSHLYRGDGVLAWSVAEDVWRMVRRLGMGGLALVRLEMFDAMGMAALLTTVQTGRGDARRRARQLAGKLRRMSHPAACAKGLLLDGQIRYQDGDRVDASQSFQRAALSFAALRTPIAERCARELAGRIQGCRAPAEVALSELGVSDEVAFLRTVAPLHEQIRGT